MKIYTKKGDDGTTALYGSGEMRVYKHMPQVEAYGVVDELSAAIGMAASLEHSAVFANEAFYRIMEDLFYLGAELSSVNSGALLDSVKSTITAARIEEIEQAIDQFSEDVPELKHFVFPGGTQLGATLHMARTIARRAERCCVALKKEWGEFGYTMRDEVLQYLNRISDLLFIMARYANKDREIFWVPEKMEK